MNNLVFFDLRFEFLVKNCIYGQILVINDQIPVKLIEQLKMFINLNLGLFGGYLRESVPCEKLETKLKKNPGTTKEKQGTLICSCTFICFPRFSFVPTPVFFPCSLNACSENVGP